MRQSEEGIAPTFIGLVDRDTYRALLRASYVWIDDVGQFVDEINGVDECIGANPGTIAHIDVLREEVTRWLDEHYPLIGEKHAH